MAGQTLWTSKNGPWILRVRVIEARNLMLGEHSPYIICSIGKHEEKTHVIKKSSTPNWNETFDLRVAFASEILHVSAWDHLFLRSDKRLGKIDVFLSDLVENQSKLEWVKFPDSDGEVHLELTAYTKEAYPGKKGFRGAITGAATWIADTAKMATTVVPATVTTSPESNSAASVSPAKSKHAEIDPVMEFYLKYTKREKNGKMVVHNLPEDLALLFKEANVTEEELKDPDIIAPLIKLMHEALSNPEMLRVKAPDVICQAKVIYDYEKQRDSDLQLCCGEIISVFHKNENGWWTGEGKYGMGDFPGNYVVEVKDTTTPSLPSRGDSKDTKKTQAQNPSHIELPKDFGIAPTPNKKVAASEGDENDVPARVAPPPPTDSKEKPSTSKTGVAPTKKAPPPPPPPPPTKTHENASHGGGGLASELGKVELKHQDPTQKPPPATTGGRGDFLAQIRGGAQLKHVEPKSLAELSSGERSNLAAIIDRAMKARRIDLRESQSASSNWDGADDSEWD